MGLNNIRNRYAFLSSKEVIVNESEGKFFCRSSDHPSRRSMNILIIEDEPQAAQRVEKLVGGNCAPMLKLLASLIR